MKINDKTLVLWGYEALFHLLPFNLTPCILCLLFHRSITRRTMKGKDYKLAEYWRINLELTFNVFWRALLLFEPKAFEHVFLCNDLYYSLGGCVFYTNIHMCCSCFLCSICVEHIPHSVVLSVLPHLWVPHSVCSCDWARRPQPSRLSDSGGGDRQHSPAVLEPRQRQRQPYHQLPHPNQDSFHGGLAEG